MIGMRLGKILMMSSSVIGLLSIMLKVVVINMISVFGLRFKMFLKLIFRYNSIRLVGSR